ncbi:putative membrane transport domain protein, partial [Vibrio harveyi]
QPVF